ncbi:MULTISPECIES: NAD(P)H-dependent oxidoreductase [Staphylococcus]|uniref:NAD(P)H-dependent oxidoreductase n=1 Tax=Staphylococcus TaxID=1279 RepID=UPI002542804D|nr:MULTISPECIES: NAD(P)H-dependent oxidoreductase [Staphylococcus]MDK4265772.1 NAD(P)H-dependent oxidoreductase [Staphylococcus warneri]
MQKILAICGSNNVESNSYLFLKNLREEFYNSHNSSISFKILRPSDYYLNFVDGSSKPFIEGVDNNDTYDDGEFIKQEIQEADFLIINSPVYSLNVSANIKNLIDRISPWSHIFKLLGKPGLILTISSGRGHLEVESYLNYIFSSFGLNIIENIHLTNRKSILNYDFTSLKQKIYKKLDSSGVYKVPFLLEKQFQEHKDSIRKQPSHYFEYEYWKNSGLMDSQTLQNYVDSYL